MSKQEGYYPAHEMQITVAKGSVKVTCVCGWQAPKGEEMDKAVSLYQRHAGLVEKR